MSEPDSTNLAQSVAQIGSYRLIRQLGSGGMSSVFRATHVDTGHEVAVKVLPRYLAKNATLLQRFLREAKTAEALEHPNIVAIFDRGSESGRYYLVLEFVPGGDLHDRVRNQGPLSAVELVSVLRAVSEGLRYAATKGLIHRDIKPANLLMTPEGLVKITDLGLALQVEDEDERVTRDGTTVGTVDYMAPEQARDSRGTSIRSDIYSLGCTSYYLLTGSPPFQGGDVAEKLRRHAQDPPPDVRDLRPEIPEALAKLVQRMMAKRQDRRYDDYDELLAALETVSTEPTVSEPLYAIIDDEEGQPKSADFSLAADDLFRLAEPPTTRLSLPAPEPTALSFPTDISLVELSALDEGPARPHRMALEPPIPLLAPRPAANNVSLVPLASASSAPRLRTSSDDSVRTYILRGLIVGIVVVLIGVGIQQLISLSYTTPAQSDAVEKDEVESPAPPEKAVVKAEPTPKPKSSPPKKDAPKLTDAKNIKPIPPTPPKREPAKWREPADFDPAQPPESPKIAGTVEAKFLPEGGGDIVPTQIEGPSVFVHRLEPPRQGRANSLSLAFETLGGTIEIADDGPFFERELKLGSRPRLVRAKPGFRPIVVLEPQTHELVKLQPALLILENNRLVLDGLDLVVKLPETAHPPTCLFLLRGGSELTIANCSITIVGPAERAFTLVKLGDPAAGTDGPAARARKFTLSRSFVRGPSVIGVHIAAGPAEVDLNRSVVLCGGGSLIECDGTAPPFSRRVFARRSILASHKSLITASSSPLFARVLASTLARVGSSDPCPLIALRDETASTPRDAISWLGYENSYIGWDGFLGCGPGGPFKVSDLSAVRAAWEESDVTSRLSHNPWSESAMGGDRALPDFRALVPDRASVLSQVGFPRGHLWAKTVGRFARLETPGLPQSPKAAGGASAKASEGADANRAGILHFDAGDPTWSGDLGRFLEPKLPRQSARVRVVATGSGKHTMTPIRLEPGVSLEVDVVPPANGLEPLSWTPVSGARADALIAVREADLVLTNARLVRGKGPSVKWLLSVEEGHLALSQSHITAPGTTSADGGDLILFRATGTKSLGPRPGPSRAWPVRPEARLTDCWLQAGGVVITAELARGVIALSHCIVSGGKAAFDLRPQNVRRDLFEADLWLDRCTLAAEHDIVHLGRWPGRSPGPDRPWLVSSQGSVYLDTYDRAPAPNTSVLFRADREAIGQGALSWQGAGDAYAVTHFAAPDKDPPLEIAKPDVVRLWGDLWGRNHFDNAVTGPTLNGGRAAVRLIVERLRPGDVLPGDFALEWNGPAPGTSKKPAHAVDVGADLDRLGVAPSPRARRH
jgi:eukaryotic-like serine/threonine-protein kinase